MGDTKDNLVIPAQQQGAASAGQLIFEQDVDTPPAVQRRELCTWCILSKHSFWASWPESKADADAEQTSCCCCSSRKHTEQAVGPS